MLSLYNLFRNELIKFYNRIIQRLSNKEIKHLRQSHLKYYHYKKVGSFQFLKCISNYTTKGNQGEAKRTIIKIITLKLNRLNIIPIDVKANSGTWNL